MVHVTKFLSAEFWPADAPKPILGVTSPSLISCKKTNLDILFVLSKSSSTRVKHVFAMHDRVYGRLHDFLGGLSQVLELPCEVMFSEFTGEIYCECLGRLVTASTHWQRRAAPDGETTFFVCWCSAILLWPMASKSLSRQRRDASLLSSSTNTFLHCRLRDNVVTRTARKHTWFLHALFVLDVNEIRNKTL